MAKVCPKCGYQRKDSDIAPDWQCPSCGVAYAKVERKLEEEKIRQQIAEAEHDKEPGLADRAKALAPRFLIGAGLVAIAILSWQYIVAPGIAEWKYQKQVDDYNAKLDSMEDDLKFITEFEAEWNSSLNLAANSPRISLPPQVTRMQDKKKNWADHDFEDLCLQKAKPLFSRHMDGTINTIIAMLPINAKEPKEIMEDSLNAKKDYLEAVQSCVPAKPTR